jgi:hypothetical protein
MAADRDTHPIHKDWIKASQFFAKITNLLLVPGAQYQVVSDGWHR